MAKKKKKVISFFKYLTVVMIIVTIITLGLVKFINILPTEYFYVLLGLVVLIGVINSYLILSNGGGKKRIIGTLSTIIYVIILVVVIIYLLNTIGFLKKFGFSNYKTENYSVLVLNDSKVEDIVDLDKKIMGSLEFNNDGLKITNGVNTFNVNPNDEILLSLSNEKEKLLYIDKNGKMHLKGDGSKLEIEGLTTLNDNFRILEDGSIEANNGKFKGDIEGSYISGSTFKIEHGPSSIYLDFSGISMNKYEFGTTPGDLGSYYSTRLDWDGLITNGTVTCKSLTQTSDERLKTDFNQVSDKLIDAYMEIPIYTFKWKKIINSDINIGVKAQDIIRAFDKNEINYEHYDIINHINEKMYGFDTLGVNYQVLNNLTMYITQKHEKKILELEEKIRLLELKIDGDN